MSVIGQSQLFMNTETTVCGEVLLKMGTFVVAFLITSDSQLTATL